MNMNIPKTNGKLSSIYGFFYQDGIPVPISVRFQARLPIEFNPDIGKAKPRPYGGIFENEEIAKKLFEKKEDSSYKEDKFYKLAVNLKENNDKLKDLLMKWNPNNDPNICGDPEKTIFVGNLPYSLNESMIEKSFRIYGKIEKIRLIYDKEGKSRGYAFIEYKSKDDAKEAYKKAYNLVLLNRRIIVDYERGRVSKSFIPVKLGGKMPRKRRLPTKIENKLNEMYEKHEDLKIEKLEKFKFNNREFLGNKRELDHKENEEIEQGEIQN